MFLLGRFKYLFLFLLLLSGCAANNENSSNKVFSYKAEEENWVSIEKKLIAKSNDDWQSFAQDSKIPVSILKRFNHKRINNKMRSGDIVLIPAKSMHQVKNGETSIGLALKYGLTFSEFVGINSLVEPYELKIGKKVKVIEVNALKIQRKITVGFESKKEVVKDKKENFLWPVEGKVISRFGLQATGIHNDAILISVKPNASIVAVKAGEVAYTGNEVGNYGNLIIIQHDNNWFSSYAHLGEIIVKKGEFVKAKQDIGYADKTELYFSLRKGANSVNPLKYLPKIYRGKNVR